MQSMLDQYMMMVWHESISRTTGFPAGTRRNNNVFTTSTRRRRRRVDVVKTLFLRHVCVGLLSRSIDRWIEMSWCSFDVAVSNVLHSISWQWSPHSLTLKACYRNKQYVHENKGSGWKSTLLYSWVPCPVHSIWTSFPYGSACPCQCQLSMLYCFLKFMGTYFRPCGGWV